MLLSVLIGMPASVTGQDAVSSGRATERRERNRPILRIRSESPTAPTVALRFVPEADGKLWLYSAGWDKIVRRWRVAGTGDDRPALEHDRTLKWPIYRGVRGRIDALSVHAGKQGHRLAVGGFGAKSSQISLLHVDDPTAGSTLFDFGTAARQVIWALQFTPDGNSLLVGEGMHAASDTAQLTLWRLTADRLQLACTASGLREAERLAVSPDGRSVAVAGPAADGKGQLVRIWDIDRLARGLRDPGQNTVQQTEPVQSVRIEANWPRTVRGLTWQDDSTWVAGTVLGLAWGHLDGRTELAGFRDLSETDSIFQGIKFKQLSEDSGQASNRSDRPVEFWYVPLADAKETINWSSRLRLEHLDPGESWSFPAAERIANQKGFAVQRVVDGRPFESEARFPMTRNRGYRMEFHTYVTAVDAVPKRKIVLGVWDHGLGHVVLRNSVDRFGITLPDSTFREVHSVALSPDARFVAAAGVAEVFQGIGSDRNRHTVYQIRLWSAETGRLLAKVPDDSSTEAGPPVGGPIAGVGIVADDAGNPVVRFTVGHVTDKSPPAYQQFLPTFPSFGIQPGQSLPEQNNGKPHAVVTADKARASAQDLSPIEVAKGRLFRVLKQQSSWINVDLVDSSGKLQNRWLQQNDVNLLDRWPWPRLTSVPTQAGLTTESPRLGGQVQLTVRGWKLSNGEQEVGPFPCLPGNLPTCGVQFQKDGRQLVALGLIDGVQIWDMARVARDGRAAILRSFYGHDSQITSLDVSPDARWLVSGSDDGTICGWSLEGLGRTNELGLSLDGGLRITSVVRNSPAWEAGFEEGQVVSELYVAGRPITGSRTIRQALLQPVPGEELLVKVRSGGSESTVEMMTPVSWDPLWTYYPFHDGYWVMWTPAGYFTAAAGAGFGDHESRVEWHVNPSQTKSKHGRQSGVVSMRAIDFEREFRNEDTVTQVARSLQPVDVDLPLVPEISLERLGGTVRLETELTGENQTVVERSVWLNGQRVALENPVANGNRPLDVSYPAESYRTGRNTVTGIVTVARRTAGGDRRSSFVRTVVFEHAGGNRARPRLHYVGVGVTALDERIVESKLRLEPLDSADNDVIEVGQTLRESASKLARQGAAGGWDLAAFDQGTFRVLAEGAGDAPTKPNMMAALTALGQQVNPDDFAVIMLAGHGVLRNLQGQPDEFHFVARDTLVARKELGDALAALPCRSLLVLDTCHSGAGRAANIEGQVEGLVKVLVGPQILTSCGRDQESEVAVGYDHGLFTLALLEAIDGQSRVTEPLTQSRDRDGDGIVTVEEICTYVQDRTPDLIRILRMDRVKQDPQVLRSTSFEEIGRFPASVR